MGQRQLLVVSTCTYIYMVLYFTMGVTVFCLLVILCAIIMFNWYKNYSSLSMFDCLYQTMTSILYCVLKIYAELVPTVILLIRVDLNLRVFLKLVNKLTYN